MTTIAWDGQLLAANRGAVTGQIVNRENKISLVKIPRPHWTLPGVRAGDRAYVAGAGTTYQVKRYALWLQRADDEDPPLVDESESLIVTRHVVLHVDAAGLGTRVVRRPVGIGSGGEIALGALLAGADAYRAVSLVARHVAPNNAFGGVQVVERAWL